MIKIRIEVLMCIWVIVLVGRKFVRVLGKGLCV